VLAIAVLTQSGSSARLVSHYRPQVPIIALCPSEETARRASLYWGVTPLQIQVADRLEDLERQIQIQLSNQGMLQRGDSLVLTGGHPIYRYGPTNFLKVITIE
jgi:pyruvate kinase